MFKIISLKKRPLLSEYSTPSHSLSKLLTKKNQSKWNGKLVQYLPLGIITNAYAIYAPNNFLSTKKNKTEITKIDISVFWIISVRFLFSSLLFKLYAFIYL